jgi:hypothetical protein
VGFKSHFRTATTGKARFSLGMLKNVRLQEPMASENP